MNLIGLANSGLGPRLAMFLGGWLPRPVTRALARRLAGRVAKRSETPLVRALRLNQAVVRGLPLGDPALDGLVAGLLQQAGAGYSDLYWAIPRGVKALHQISHFDPEFEAALRRGLDSGRGLIVVGAHMSSFDLFLVSLASKGYRALGLAYPEIQGSYPVLNRLRRDHGLEVMPISVPALRAAIRRLQQGRLVLTGVDRPDIHGDLLTFFGRPARMPTGHARLAVRTGALVLAGVCQAEGIGRYRLVGTDLIDPRDFGQGEAAVHGLAQHVITVLEGYIRERPQEWFMFYPVWPDAFEPV